MWHLPEFMVPSWAAASGVGILGITLFNITAVAFTAVKRGCPTTRGPACSWPIVVHASIDTFAGTLGAISGSPS